MALFLSTYRNKVDKKGRVSVPAPFRAVLASQPFAGIVAYPALKQPCIEGASLAYIEKIYGMIDALDPMSEERDLIANGILGACVQLPFDGEGRIMLPRELLEAASITEEAVFVGKGDTFDVWQPEAYAIYAARARDLVRERRFLLRPGAGQNTTTPGGGGA